MIKHSIYKGIIGSVGLLIFYFVIVGSISGRSFAQVQFLGDWYWIISLVLGFGVQISLFTYLRALHRERMSRAVAATSGTVSGLSMVACCAHYLVNVLPFIGISAFATVVAQYQTSLFVVAVLSNIAGIVYMLYQLKSFNSQLHA